MRSCIFAFWLAVACSGESAHLPVGAAAPVAVDSDGDGLLDRDESELGTDPASVDTDGDTYGDGDEVTEGTDPLDPDSRIYVGFWPYNADKDALGAPALPDGEIPVGEPLARLVGVDQYGDELDLYDFLGQGRDTVVAGYGVVPCGGETWAAWLSTGGALDALGLEAELGPARDAVDQGRLGFVTVLMVDANGEPADAAVVAQWDAVFPHPAVPVISDPGQAFRAALVDGTTGFFPSAVLIDGEGAVVGVGHVEEMLALAQQRLP